MPEVLGLGGVRGVMFDCYKTLIDIKTDENSVETYRPVSRWLKYHGVAISSEDLMREYKRKCREEIDRCNERHPELKVEEIFSRVIRERGSWPVDDKNVGIEAARLFRSASLRRLKAFPQSLKLLEKAQGLPSGHRL